MSDIGKEYGTALFMLGCEQKTLTEYADGLQTVRVTFSQQPDYAALLASPGIPLSERLSALTAAFGDAIPEAVLSFMHLLCEKGRIDCFFDAADEFAALLNAHNRVSKAHVASAVELTAQEREKLHKKLKRLAHGRVETTYTLDPSLLGGLIIELDGKVLDGSLRQRLRDIKDVMNT